MRYNESVAFRKIFKRTDSPYMRQVMDNIDKKCYVETRADLEGEIQGGTVDKIIRDKYGIPVCVRVVCTPPGQKPQYDFIEVSRISFFEPYDHIVDIGAYSSGGEYFEECEEFEEDEDSIEPDARGEEEA